MASSMIKGFLLDLSGVIYTRDEVIPSAIDAVERMR
jgi:ribonucleotide monophosphatase NagD (HAD superfamily)